MTGFSQAVRWLKDGKKVRSPRYGDDSYFYLEWGKIKFVVDCCLDDADFELDDFEATDWEIYEKKNTLSEKMIDTSQSASISENDEFWVFKFKDTKKTINKLRERLYNDEWVGKFLKTHKVHIDWLFKDELGRRFI